MEWLIHQAWFQGSAIGFVTGVFGAMRVDYMAFKSWKSWHEAAIYDWRTASWRWLQGAVTSAVGGAPVGSLISLLIS